jgi:hypothetical protein
VLPHTDTSWSGFDTVEAVLRGLEVMLELPDSPEWTVLLSGSDYPITPASHILSELRVSRYDGYMHYERLDPNNPRRPWHGECIQRYFRAPLGAERNHPFYGRWCFVGEGWFTLRRHAIERLLERHREGGELTEWFRRCQVPGEAYFQTVLVNEPDLSIHDDYKRFIEWEEGSRHPNVLTTAQLPDLIASQAHFARKFDSSIDGAILDRLDEVLDAAD